MTPPGTFDRVYAALKQRLRDGVYRPGDRLEPAALSDDLNASVTPVRDALHRLTGERLVEAPRHEGFRVPMLTEPLLRQLYEWHLDLLILALMKRHAAAIDEEIAIDHAKSDAAAHERHNHLFLALARSARNHELLDAVEAVTLRLEPVQRLEQLFLDGTDCETKGIVAALRANDRKMLRASLLRYHRRRQKIVPELLASLLSA